MIQMVEIQLEHKCTRYRVKMNAGHTFEEVRATARAVKIFGLRAGELAGLIEDAKREGNLGEIDGTVSPVMSRNLAIFGNRMNKNKDGVGELRGERGSVARGKFQLSCEKNGDVLERLQRIGTRQIAIVEVRKVLTDNRVTTLDIDPERTQIHQVAIEGKKITTHYDSEHELRVVRIDGKDYVFDSKSNETIVPLMLDPTLAKRISVSPETQMFGDIRAGDHAKTPFRLIGTQYTKPEDGSELIHGC